MTEKAKGRAAQPGFIISGAIYVAANLASAAAPFMLLPLLTRVLDTSAYGQIVNFFMLVSLCGATSGLSLHGALGVRWFKLQSADFSRFAATCLLLVALSSTATAAVAVVLVSLFHIELGLSAGWIAIAAILAGAMVMLNMRLVLWQNQHEPVSVATLQFTNSVLNMALSLVGVLVLGLGAEGRMGGAAVAGCALAVLAVVLLVRSGEAFGMPAMSDARRALRFGLPLVPHALAGAAAVNVDRLIVADQLGASAVGIYGVASQLGMVMVILADAFVKAYTPWMFERLSQGSDRDLEAVVGVTYAIVPIASIAALLIGAILQFIGPWVLGEQFHAALPLLWWFLLGGTFTWLYLSVANFFFFSSRTEYISLVTVSGAALGTISCLILVPRFGLVGAAASFALTQALIFLAALKLVTRLRPLPWLSVRSALAAALALAQSREPRQ